MLNDMALMLRRGPAWSDSDNVACPEGGVGVVNEVVLRVGEPLGIKCQLEGGPGILDESRQGRRTL